jgi:hypothetical protein
MLDGMTADEFVGWKAYERVEPFGFMWWDWVQSRIAALLDWQLTKKERSHYRTQEQLKWKRPEALFVTRARRKAKRVGRSPKIRRD